MSSLPSLHAIFFLFHSITLLLFSLRTYGAAETVHVVAVNSLLPGDVCSSSQGMNDAGKMMEIAQRHGPCSSLPHPNKLDHELLLDRDQSRVVALLSHHPPSYNHPPTATSTSLSASSIPSTSGSSLGTGNYIVTAGFGTPTKQYSLIFDTGSDVTWIQCQPCVSFCYPQQDPIFDPAQSSTYSNISCTSLSCSQLSTSGCSGSTCLYAVQYGDNSLTVGFFARDTLTLTPSDVLPNFRFGCGERNRGSFGQAAGLLGLGRHPVSLVSQSAKKYGRVFSYCIPSTSSSTGYLSFGGKSAPAQTKYTPMLANANYSSFYFLNLTGISVGGRQLAIKPTVFSTGGMIIDSGTVITRLPKTAYLALRTAFRRRMLDYPMVPAVSILDTCYDLSGNSSVMLPAVSFRFAGGVSVDLDASGIVYVVTVSQVCLAFAGNTDDGELGIYGNTQQRTFNVVYNLHRKVIGFGPRGCN